MRESGRASFFSRIQTQGAAMGMLLVFLAVMAVGERRTALTADEVGHVAAGYALLARGPAEPAATPSWPDVWSALPIYIGRPDLPLEHLNGWGSEVGWPLFVADFGYRAFGVTRSITGGWYRAEPEIPDPLQGTQSTLAARWPAMLLALVLGAVVFRWARRGWGASSGLIALAALLLDPLLPAYGRLALPDVGTALIGTAVLYGAWRWRQTAWRPNLTLGLVGVGLLALAARGLLVEPQAVEVFVLGMRRQMPLWYLPAAFLWKEPLPWIAALVLALASGRGKTGCLVGGRVLFAGPHPPPAPLLPPTNMRKRSFGFRTTAAWWGKEGGMVVARHFLKGKGGICTPSEACKSPLTTNSPFPPSASLGERRGGGIEGRHGLFSGQSLWVGLCLVLYALWAVRVGADGGYRAVLPLHPVAALVIGVRLARWLRRGGWWRAGIGLALVGWGLLEIVAVFPNEIGYFNQLVGGNGYRYLSDSNVEWGQSAYAAYDYQQADPEVQLQPPAYRIRPAAGRYLVNGTALQEGNGTDRYAYEWFRNRTPTAVLTHSLLLYEVPPPDLAWFAQCKPAGAALPLLSPEVIAAESGQRYLRLVEFDCETSWVYPWGGTAKGLYGFPYAMVAPERFCWSTLQPCAPELREPFAARRLAPAAVSFVHPEEAGALPALILYEKSPGLPEMPESQVVYAASALTPLTMVTGSVAVTLPVALQEPLDFLGMKAYREEGAWTVESWWRVREGAFTRPFSIMAHALTEGGNVVVADGLGVDPVQLRAGDVVVQRHRFILPEGTARFWLRTGIYWLDTLERWPLQNVPAADAFFIEVGP